MNLRHPLTDRHEAFTQIQRLVKAKTHFRKFLSPTPKNVSWEKPQIYVNLSKTAVNQKHVTSKHTNMWTSDYHNYVSSRINALQNGTELGAITIRDFCAT